MKSTVHEVVKIRKTCAVTNVLDGILNGVFIFLHGFLVKVKGKVVLVLN
jgi:hypothetical protein